MNTKRVGRESDEQDSTVSVWLNYFLAAGVIAGLIALDIYTEKELMDGTIIGMILMKALDGLTKMNDYFFPGRRNTPASNGYPQEKSNA